VSDVTYKLQLPETSAIHPVFHVSQLKTAVPSSQTVAELPQALEGWQVPVKILQHRVHATNHNVTPQVLIQWSNLPRSLATWEDTEALQQRFPCAHAWGQADFVGEGMSASPRRHNVTQPPSRQATLIQTTTRSPRTGPSQSQGGAFGSTEPMCILRGANGREPRLDTAAPLGSRRGHGPCINTREIERRNNNYYLNRTIQLILSSSILRVWASLWLHLANSLPFFPNSPSLLSLMLTRIRGSIVC
jgi:hypothetical protein